MSVPKRIGELALITMRSFRSGEVLGDAVLEADWYDARVAMLMGYLHREKFFQIAAGRTYRRSEWARAIAAVYLFGDWSTERWPIKRTITAAMSAEILKHLYPQTSIPNWWSLPDSELWKKRQ